MPDEPLQLAITVPTYNEAESVPALLDALEAYLPTIPGLRTTVLVVDDNSPDGTAKVVEEQQAIRGSAAFELELLSRSGKHGLGRAYIEGFAWLLEHGSYDYILQMDADLSHNPRYIGPFLQAAVDAQLVVGARWTRGGATPDWGIHRRFISWAGNRYARLLLGTRITDWTGGFNLYATDLLRQVDLSTLQATGYGFQIELKYRCLDLANNVRQVPIVFLDRRVGQSKIPADTILKNLILVPKITYERRRANALLNR